MGKYLKFPLRDKGLAHMTVNIRTRAEITCWNLIIPMMTKLRHIRTATQPKQIKPLTGFRFLMQVVAWSAVGLLIGFGLSFIRACLL
jgi:hypothetical protein